MSATTGYVSPLQASSNGTSESQPLNSEEEHGPQTFVQCATPQFHPLEHVGKVDSFKCNFLHLLV